MENSKGPSSIRNMMYNGKHPLLPPKSPFPCISPSYVEYVPIPATGPKGFPKPREGNSHHQRTSSESFLIEEQPSWLDELLNEPETPVRKAGHRRSSSDSFAYTDIANGAYVDYVAQDECKLQNLTSVPSWGSQDFDHHKDARHAAYAELNSSGKPNIRAWESSLHSAGHPSGLPSARDNVLHSSGSSGTLQEADGVLSTAMEKQNPVQSGPHDLKISSERMDSSGAKPSASETDSKRAKQQFAQRSRVRKLQYIAELERNVQALQASI
ncbi:unnamed protein product [Ilex paraguariensis]|uniref:BZIP domain-containing protein n=1 Tax=Ilex paraguariensis TaxID=185542 RepID=A0ABC8TL26_9AQUA